MKLLIISALSVVFLGFLGFILFFAKQQAKTTSKPLSMNGWVRGKAEAQNVLVEFSDIQCPACRANEPFVQQALKDFDGKLKLVYKHFPLMGHPFAMEGSRVLEAAGKQGKFWEMHDLLFEKQDEWGGPNVNSATPFFEKYAKSLELNMDQFKKDVQDKAFDAKINSTRDEGIEQGVDATPTFFINNKRISSVGTYEEFKSALQAEMK